MKRLTTILALVIGVVIAPNHVVTSTLPYIAVKNVKDVPDANNEQAVPDVPSVNNAFKTFEITAYTNGYESTSKRPGDPAYGITASGVHTQEGVTMACPKGMAFGTRVYVPALDHTYVCQDRGGAITKGHLDVFFNDYDDAMDFGRQELTARIIPPTKASLDAINKEEDD